MHSSGKVGSANGWETSLVRSGDGPKPLVFSYGVFTVLLADSWVNYLSGVMVRRWVTSPRVQSCQEAMNLNCSRRMVHVVQLPADHLARCMLLDLFRS